LEQRVNWGLKGGSAFVRHWSAALPVFECTLLARWAWMRSNMVRILRFHSFLWLPFDAAKYATKFYLPEIRTRDLGWDRNKIIETNVQCLGSKSAKHFKAFLTHRNFPKNFSIRILAGVYHSIVIKHVTQ